MSFFSAWLEASFQDELDPGNVQHEEHARNLVVALVQQLETKALESGDFLTKNKLEEIISNMKVRSWSACALHRKEIASKTYVLRVPNLSLPKTTTTYDYLFRSYLFDIVRDCLIGIFLIPKSQLSELSIHIYPCMIICLSLVKSSLEMAKKKSNCVSSLFLCGFILDTGRERQKLAGRFVR